jgi:hypothetical protein
MIADILGYLFPGGPYSDRSRARRALRHIEAGREVYFAAVRLPATGKAEGGFVRLRLSQAWWRPNREVGIGELVLCENECHVESRPVDPESFRRGAPKYWTLVTITSGQLESTIAVSEENSYVLLRALIPRDMH